VGSGLNRRGGQESHRQRDFVRPSRNLLRNRDRASLPQLMRNKTRGETMGAWFKDLTLTEPRTMLACFGGWSLDALDVQIFSFVIPSLLAVWGITTAEAGELGTITLLVSAFGGWIAGALADRIGRVRVLQ